MFYLLHVWPVDVTITLLVMQRGIFCSWYGHACVLQGYSYTSSNIQAGQGCTL